MMFRRVRPQWPRPDNVRAFTTTRAGGVSVGPYASLNLGRSAGDDPAAVAENRSRFAAALPAAPGWVSQVHGIRVARRDRTAGVGNDSAATSGTAATPVEADAVVTFAPDLPCTVLTADCMPVLFCDDDGSRVAAAHAGWRGLAAGVLEATVAALEAEPASLMAWLGPAIGPEAFEVGEDVLAAFEGARTDPEKHFRAGGIAGPTATGADGSPRWRCDLYGLARDALAAVGVERVHGGGYCTYTDRDRFFSYRRDGVTGRMATTIWFK